MKYDISNVSISEIAEGIILDYLGDKVNEVKCIDIEGLLTDYFKLQIVYESFAEDDPCRDGFIADGMKTICVWRNGTKQNILFPKGTVVFDRYLLLPEQSCHRRFCMAHEGRHNVFAKHNASLLGTFHSEYDREMNYSIEQFHELFNLHEIQANNMAAAFLVPRFLAERLLKSFYPRRKKISVYGESTMFADDRQKFIDMSDQLGVSPKTLLIQMKQYGMIKLCTMDELIKAMKKKGGWGDDTYQHIAEVPN